MPELKKRANLSQSLFNFTYQKLKVGDPLFSPNKPDKFQDPGLNTWGILWQVKLD